MKNYDIFYNKLTRSFQNKPTAIRCLQIVNSLLTKIMYLVYPLMLIYLFCKQPNRLIAFILIPAISFVLVSVVRKLLNAPRPYETWNITPLILKIPRDNLCQVVMSFRQPLSAWLFYG